MSVAKVSSTCPYCKEAIIAGAIRCKHCQSDLAEAKRTRRNPFTKFNTFRYGFFTGIVLSIALVLFFIFGLKS